MNEKIIVIGGGASALMLASLMPKKSVILIDNNPTLGVKIAISGGGKCNITNQNMDSSYYVGEAEFIESVIGSFDQNALLSWLKKYHLKPILKKNSQYFCKESAKEILDIFLKESKRQTLFCNEKVLNVSKRGNYFTVKTDRRILTSEQVVIASGGLSFPKLGATSIGYEAAESFGHTVTRTYPALVGFTVQKEQFFFKELSGVSVENIVVRIGENICRGSLLFAHKGVSGPAILDASLYWEKGEIEIDFLPDFLWKELQKSKKQISTFLPLPKRFTKAFLVQLNLEDKRGDMITAEELQQLKRINHYRFSPAGTFGYSKAEVTKGGVSTDEIDAKTMMSKKEQGLYIVGEVLNVTGKLGGYNFQWAFSSAYKCAEHLTGSLDEN